MRKSFLFVILICILLTSCKKDQETVIDTNPVPCETRTIFQSNPNAEYSISDEELYYRSSNDTTGCVLSAINVNSNGLLDFCGTMQLYRGLNINGTFCIRGTLKMVENLTINSGGLLKVDGVVRLPAGSLILNGTIDFISPNSSLYVNGNVIRNAGSAVLHPENNIGPTILP